MTFDIENKPSQRRTDAFSENSACKRLGPHDRRFKTLEYPKAEPEKTGIHKAFIKAELARYGYTQQRIADELNLRITTVSMVVRGVGKSRRVAEFIAEKTGLTLEQMWPGKYKENNKDAAKPD